MGYNNVKQSIETSELNQSMKSKSFFSFFSQQVSSWFIAIVTGIDRRKRETEQ